MNRTARSLRLLAIPTLAIALAACGTLADDTAATVERVRLDVGDGERTYEAVEVERGRAESAARSLAGVPVVVGELDRPTEGRIPSAAMTAALTMEIRNALLERIENQPDPAEIDAQVEGFTQAFPDVDRSIVLPLLRSLFAFDLAEPNGAPMDESVLRGVYDRMGRDYWDRVYGETICLNGIAVEDEAQAREFERELGRPRRGRAAEDVVADALNTVPESAEFGRPTVESAQLGCRPIREFVQEGLPVNQTHLIDALRRLPACEDGDAERCRAAVLPLESPQLTEEQQANPPYVVLFVTDRQAPTFDVVRDVLEQRLAIPAVREVFDMPVSVDARYGTWDPLFVRVISPAGPIDGTFAQPTRLEQQAGILPAG